MRKHGRERQGSILTVVRTHARPMTAQKTLGSPRLKEAVLAPVTVHRAPFALADVETTSTPTVVSQQCARKAHLPVLSSRHAGAGLEQQAGRSGANLRTRLAQATAFHVRHLWPRARMICTA